MRNIHKAVAENSRWKLSYVLVIKSNETINELINVPFVGLHCTATKSLGPLRVV